MDTKQLFLKKENVLEKADEAYKAAMFVYAEGYKTFLDSAKIEREAVATSIEMAKKEGFSEYTIGDKIEVGGKYYYNNRNKSLFLFKIGKGDVEALGLRILAAHIDSPRLDLKQNPLYEDSQMCFLKTHYYGGIKKYQWTAIPLALHGAVILKDGSSVSVCIGEDENDPVFYINDLLPHLGADQSAKPLGSAIPGESLNLLVGGVPYVAEGDEKDKIKTNILVLLNEKYGMTEEDFLTAELTAVPAFKAKDVGLDRVFVGAYGHDDRVCAYPEMTALFESKDELNTSIVVLADKEETGSEGNTGMQCDLILDLINEICAALNANPAKVRAASKCLSADVCAAYDPNFAEVFEKKNSALLSCGVVLTKYTGSRGKGGTNDANAEFVGFVRRAMAEYGVIWQAGELGRVDVGGGGTVAKFISKHNIDVVDLGVPVIAMHAPFEVISKVDLYESYKAFCAFCKF